MMTRLMLIAGVVIAFQSPQPRAQTTRPRVPVEQLDEAKLKALPPDTTIVFGRGRQATKAEIIEGARRLQQRGPQIRERAGTLANEFRIRRERFLEQERQRIGKANAAARAELARRAVSRPAVTTNPGRTRIEQEAANLYTRYQKASPAERAAIDRRADELLRELIRIDPKRIRR